MTTKERRIERRRQERRDGLSVRQFVRERMQGRKDTVFNKRTLAAKGLTVGWVG